jgi:two-component sensor histidine kinase
MVLHEMTTNAAKYGALSTRRGNLEITWQVSDVDKSVELVWQERGGATGKARVSSGFGTKLIDHVTSHDLDGRTKVDFDPAGVCWTIAFPVRDPGGGRPETSSFATA